MHQEPRTSTSTFKWTLYELIKNKKRNEQQQQPQHSSTEQNKANKKNENENKNQNQNKQESNRINELDFPAIKLRFISLIRSFVRLNVKQTKNASFRFPK